MAKAKNLTISFFPINEAVWSKATKNHPYHPQANGAIELMNPMIYSMLKILIRG